MVVRVGGNGLGRDIPRAPAGRVGTARTVVAVNDLTTPEALAHLLAHDSTYDPWPGQVTARGNGLVLNGFTNRQAAVDRLVSRSSKAILTAPAGTRSSPTPPARPTAPTPWPWSRTRSSASAKAR